MYHLVNQRPPRLITPPQFFPMQLLRKVLAFLYCNAPPKSFALQFASVGLEK